MNLQTYLFFEGNCKEAIEFYEEAFGAIVECLLPYSEGPPELTPVGWSDKVFHATIMFGDSLVNMSDTPADGSPRFGGLALLAHVESIEKAERLFAALEVGGEVRMPLQPTFWAPCYGIVCDRFGITWKVQS